MPCQLYLRLHSAVNSQLIRFPKKKTEMRERARLPCELIASSILPFAAFDQYEINKNLLRTFRPPIFHKNQSTRSRIDNNNKYPNNSQFCRMTKCWPPHLYGIIKITGSSHWLRIVIKIHHLAIASHTAPLRYAGPGA